MVSTSVNIKLFDFQEQAVINLIDFTTGSHKQTVIDIRVRLIMNILVILLSPTPEVAMCVCCTGRT